MIPEVLTPFPELHRKDDPVADDVITAVIAAVLPAGPAPRRITRAELPLVLAELAKDGSKATVLPEVAGFLTAGEAIDPVITENLDLVKAAQRFFDEHGMLIITALFHASLPEAYLGKRGVQVLDITGELFLNWTRRAHETGMFLINVLSPTPDLWRADRPEGATTSVSSGQLGAVACRRVRLVHAAIRSMLLAVLPDDPVPRLVQTLPGGATEWDARMREIECEDELSVPLNQEDLLATLGTFTTVVMCSLEKLAVSFTDEHREAFYFLWNVIGWHLGIGDEAALGTAPAGLDEERFPQNHLLPLAPEELDEVYRHLAQKLQHPTEQGRRLTKVLLHELAYPLPDPVQGVPAYVARYLIGDDHANKLAIERGGYSELLLSSSGLLGRWAATARLHAIPRMGIGLVSSYVTQYALRAFISQARWSERGLTIDPRIAARWGFETPPARDRTQHDGANLPVH